MKKFTILLLAWMLVANLLNATIRRVGYTATAQPVALLDFVNFQAAHDFSSAGDTIQLYPSATGSTYTGIISKRLVVLGTGYLNNSFYITGTEIANANLQNLIGFIASCDFTVDLGSANTVFQGLNGLTVRTTNRQEDLPNITINRCRNVFVLFDNSSNCDGWVVSQCTGFYLTQNNASGSFTGNRTITNLTIQNTVVYGALTLSTSPTGSFTGNKIYNCNIISGASFSLNNATFAFQNCIFEIQTFTNYTNCTFVKNVTALSATGNSITNTGANSGNQYNAVLTNVFNGYPSYTQTAGLNNQSPDNRYILKIGTNPAIGGGFLPSSSTVTDCGIFGGAASYKLSGMPAIPVFIRFNAPSAIATGTPYTMTFSINSNN